ncbi:NFACT RNA binding domain-containing protein [uncultured Campylobacter sp.]|mgnify:FL=1|uniref:NFACT RNA binding domain-containing protein n=1 Tax=uncultured Campylobacter sp. TaxID=218934 RepID=UPI0026058D52|nr:NFACT RNA binding domain-containing protein [uncultured Campylobacter sp.]
MKYQNLIQICEYLQSKKFISHIKRAGDNLFKICFDGDETLFFDMDKTSSNIHKNAAFTESKIYKAPFDVVLAKRFVKSKILNIAVPENNRILSLRVELSAGYKRLVSEIYFEFTGRFTNVIITDEAGIILEALRHFDNDFRSIRVGKKLIPLPPREIKEQKVAWIDDFSAFFEAEFKSLNERKTLSLKNVKLARIEKKTEVLSQSLKDLPSAAELLRQSELFSLRADLLKENLYKIKDYERRISLVSRTDERVEFDIQDPPKIALSQLYAEAKRLRNKSANLHLEEQNLKSKLEFYESLRELIQNAQSEQELEILLPRKRIVQERRKEGEGEQDVQNFYLGDFKISVGKNERGNIRLLKNSGKEDFWFHLKDIASAHVIVKTNKQNLSEEAVQMAAKICVNFSVKGGGKYLVDYTKRRNVKINEGALVNYVNFKTISVLKP